MDLATGAKKLIITITHNNNDGSSKIVSSCSLPLTAIKAVDMVITELAVFAFPNGKLTLVDLQPGVSIQEVEAKTSAIFENGLR
jgi:3-oxoacid CoA-transferase